jgi:hypothetical protein
MATPRAWLASHSAAVLLVLALLTIRLMQLLYNRRVIGYRAARHFLRTAQMLRQRAERLHQA